MHLTYRTGDILGPPDANAKGGSYIAHISNIPVLIRSVFIEQSTDILQIFRAFSYCCMDTLNSAKIVKDLHSVPTAL